MCVFNACFWVLTLKKFCAGAPALKALSWNSAWLLDLTMLYYKYKIRERKKNCKDYKIMLDK
jgi:hypothetical protein